MDYAQLNAILLRRKRSILLPVGQEGASAPIEMIAALLKNLEPLGFTTSRELLERLCAISAVEVEWAYGMLAGSLRKLVGAHVEWAPMYPNFPEQVMAASDAELYFNAIVHYLGDWIGLRLLPDYEKSPRPPLADTFDLEQIGLGTLDDLKTIARSLIGAKTSISASDREDLQDLVAAFRADIADILPSEIPHKENLAFTASLLLDHDVASDVLLTNYTRTATDVLRLAVALSGGDVSLAANTRFRSFKRAERRLLLSLVDRIPAPLEDMSRYREQWKRLGEKLHPGEYAEHYPNGAAAFAAIRSGQVVETFNSKVEALLAAGDADAATMLLKTRPGELARRVDQLLRMGSTTVAPVFEQVADEVSVPVLLQVLTHFGTRAASRTLRSFFPKGNVARVVSIDDTLEPLPKPVCDAVTQTCRNALVRRFGQREPLGKVYIDPQLKNHLVPFSQRSAAKSLRTLVRGSRLPLPTGDTVRFFLWWREGTVDGTRTGRVDIDLSSVMYDDDWNYKEHISYTNLRSANYRAAHSGDITSAPNGACEFIDLDLPSIVAHGGRWVVMSVLSYTRQPFDTIPECFAGWMSRSEPGSGEIFEPKTVVDKVDLSANTRVCVPAILDLKERQLYWADLALTSTPMWNNVEGNNRGLTEMGKAITTMVKTDLYTLFELHTEGRGERVDDPADADTVFSMEDGVTPFDVDTISADYL